MNSFHVAADQLRAMSAMSGYVWKTHPEDMPSSKSSMDFRGRSQPVCPLAHFRGSSIMAVNFSTCAWYPSGRLTLKRASRPGRVVSTSELADTVTSESGKTRRRYGSQFKELAVGMRRAWHVSGARSDAARHQRQLRAFERLRNRIDHFSSAARFSGM